VDDTVIIGSIFVSVLKLDISISANADANNVVAHNHRRQLMNS